MLSIFNDSLTHVVPSLTILVVCGGMLVLAVLDVLREEVEDVATIALAAVAVIGMSVEGVVTSQWITGLVSAAIAFTAYFWLGIQGKMGGGDVKLVAVPALVLGAANPFLGLFWVVVSIFVQQCIFLLWRVVVPAGQQGSTSVVTALPHVPAMAASLVISVSIFPI